MTKYKQSFEKCVNKIQKTPTNFGGKLAKLRHRCVRLWKIIHTGPVCSFYEFYEWYIFQ